MSNWSLGLSALPQKSLLVILMATGLDPDYFVRGLTLLPIWSPRHMSSVPQTVFTETPVWSSWAHFSSRYSFPSRAQQESAVHRCSVNSVGPPCLYGEGATHFAHQQWFCFFSVWTLGVGYIPKSWPILSYYLIVLITAPFSMLKRLLFSFTVWQTYCSRSC